MPYVNNDENLRFLMETVPGYREDLMKQARELYPSAPLTANENERLQLLGGRANRLRPLGNKNINEFSGGRIAGNPYSIDTRGLSKGVDDIVTATANKVRQKRRDEFTPELSDLATRKANDAEATVKRQTFISDNLNDYLEKEREWIKEQKKIKEEGAQTRQTEREKGDQTRQTERVKGDENRKTDLEQTKNNPGRGVSGTDYTNYRMSEEELIKRNEQEIELLQTDLKMLFGDNPLEHFYDGTNTADDTTRFEEIRIRIKELHAENRRIAEGMNNTMRRVIGAPENKKASSEPGAIKKWGDLN